MDYPNLSEVIKKFNAGDKNLRNFNHKEYSGFISDYYRYFDAVLQMLESITRENFRVGAVTDFNIHLENKEIDESSASNTNKYNLFVPIKVICFKYRKQNKLELKFGFAPKLAHSECFLNNAKDKKFYWEYKVREIIIYAYYFCRGKVYFEDEKSDNSSIEDLTEKLDKKEYREEIKKVMSGLKPLNKDLTILLLIMCECLYRVKNCKSTSGFFAKLGIYNNKVGGNIQIEAKDILDSLYIPIYFQNGMSISIKDKLQAIDVPKFGTSPNSNSHSPIGNKKIPSEVWGVIPIDQRKYLGPPPKPPANKVYKIVIHSKYDTLWYKNYIGKKFSVEKYNNRVDGFEYKLVNNSNSKIQQQLQQKYPNSKGFAFYREDMK